MRLLHKFIKKLAILTGYNAVLTRKYEYAIPGDYAQILPLAQYAPWISDTAFNETYEVIKNYTLVDKYRCYELWKLVEQSAKLRGAFIEIGVWKGGTSALIAKKAKLDGIGDNVYVCDTFTGVVKAGPNDSTYKGGEHADTSREIVETLFDTLELDNTKILTGIFPDETSALIQEEVFRFCHIDVDVYESAKDIIDWLWPKLVVGGIVVFDDYGFHRADGITLFVNEERLKNDRLVIHNLNGHAVLIKISN